MANGAYLFHWRRNFQYVTAPTTIISVICRSLQQDQKFAIPPTPQQTHLYNPTNNIKHIQQTKRS